MELSEFYKLCAKSAKINSDYRHGQNLFNCLCQVRPDLSEKVRGTDKDPFYAFSMKDPRLNKFYKFLNENWIKIIKR